MVYGEAMFRLYSQFVEGVSRHHGINYSNEKRLGHDGTWTHSESLQNSKHLIQRKTKMHK